MVANPTTAGPADHGDRCEQFADDLRGDGFDVSAPDIGDVVRY